MVKVGHAILLGVGQLHDPVGCSLESPRKQKALANVTTLLTPEGLQVAAVAGPAPQPQKVALCATYGPESWMMHKARSAVAKFHSDASNEKHKHRKASGRGETRFELGLHRKTMSTIPIVFEESTSRTPTSAQQVLLIAFAHLPSSQCTILIRRIRPSPLLSV